MASASLGILAALAFVLGLIACAVWLLRRMGAGAIGGRTRLPVEVVQRLPLGPKAGLAVVRVGEKVMVVSMGEGGVHALCDVDETDRQRVLASSTVPTPLASSASASRAFSRFVGRSAPVASAAAPFATSLSTALSTAPDAAPETPSATPSATASGPTLSTPATASAAAPVAPASAPVRAVPDRDLRAVLSMTLAPATRLLGVLALVATTAAVSPLATAGAQAAPATAAATPTTPTASATAASATAALTAGQAAAQVVPQLDLRVGSGDAPELRLNGTVGIVLMMGLLTLVPTLLLMMTGFTRILIVLHFLKQAMGTQSAPPAHLVAGLALLLTGFVMAPTISEANRTALQPWLAGEIQQVEMLKEGAKPFRTFMLAQTNEKDLRTFVEMSRMERPATPDDVPLHVLMAAFVASELRTAFQIGFAIYLPFIVIDAVVASVLMAMGMFMLPPAMISLPFKLLLFVLVDGWSLTIQSLIQSFK
jgi:flagellar biosynthetic protein FliP